MGLRKRATAIIKRTAEHCVHLTVVPYVHALMFAKISSRITGKDRKEIANDAIDAPASRTVGPSLPKLAPGVQSALEAAGIPLISCSEW